jgi:hypothetical protein
MPSQHIRPHRNTREYVDNRPPGMTWKQYGWLTCHRPDILEQIRTDHAHRNSGGASQNNTPLRVGGRRAKWPDRCRHCNQTISKGDRVAWHEHKIMHAQCHNTLRTAELDQTCRDGANARRRRHHSSAGAKKQSGRAGS